VKKIVLVVLLAVAFLSVAETAMAGYYAAPRVYGRVVDYGPYYKPYYPDPRVVYVAPPVAYYPPVVYQAPTVVVRQAPTVVYAPRPHYYPAPRYYAPYCH
jgi:hypothetical protein